MRRSLRCRSRVRLRRVCAEKAIHSCHQDFPSMVPATTMRPHDDLVPLLGVRPRGPARPPLVPRSGRPGDRKLLSSRPPRRSRRALPCRAAARSPAGTAPGRRPRRDWPCPTSTAPPGRRNGHTTPSPDFGRLRGIGGNARLSADVARVRDGAASTSFPSIGQFKDGVRPIRDRPAVIARTPWKPLA